MRDDHKTGWHWAQIPLARCCLPCRSVPTYLRWAFLFFILLLGGLLRWAYYINMDRAPIDESRYLSTIHEWLLSGKMPDTYLSLPFYPYCMVHISKATGIAPEIVSHWGALICGLLLLWLIYVVTQKLFSHNLVALMSVGIAAVAPYLVRHGMVVLREQFYWPMFMLMMMLALIVLAEQCYSRRYCLIGAMSIIAAVGFLTRIEGIELLLLGVVGVWMSKVHYRQRMVETMLFVVLFAGLWLGGIRLTTGLWFPHNYWSKIYQLDKMTEI